MNESFRLDAVRSETCSSCEAENADSSRARFEYCSPSISCSFHHRRIERRRETCGNRRESRKDSEDELSPPDLERKHVCVQPPAPAPPSNEPAPQLERGP